MIYNTKFAIIGIGVSGLVSAKHCLENGFGITVFEKNSDIGGVWFSKSYPDIRLQTTKNSYAFSDFPYKQSVGLYPTGYEIREYLKQYAEKHNILQYTKFNSEVKSTFFNIKTNKWEIKYIDKSSGLYHIETFDYLIICSGFYTDTIKSTLDIQYACSTKILYPCDFSQKKSFDLEKIRNKNIVVIGNGPSGCDLANVCYKAGAKNTTILYRSNRWIFRRFLWNKISTDKLLNRFFMTLANITPKVFIIISIIICYYIIYIFVHNIWCLSDILPPFNTVTRQNLVLNEDIMGHIYKKNINYIKTRSIDIRKDYIHTEKQKYEYDYCIIATGYTQGIPFLNMKEVPLLYNHILHPNIQNCGFIGFAASFNWVQISELQIQWYIKYITKEITNVSESQMINKIKEDYKQNSYNSHDYHDLATSTYIYCDHIASQIKNKSKYTPYQLKYWFNSPDHDLWSPTN